MIVIILLNIQTSSTRAFTWNVYGVVQTIAGQNWERSALPIATRARLAMLTYPTHVPKIFPQVVVIVVHMQCSGPRNRVQFHQF